MLNPTHSYDFSFSTMIFRCCLFFPILYTLVNNKSLIINLGDGLLSPKGSNLCKSSTKLKLTLYSLNSYSTFTFSIKSFFVKL